MCVFGPRFSFDFSLSEGPVFVSSCSPWWRSHRMSMSGWIRPPPSASASVNTRILHSVTLCSFFFTVYACKTDHRITVILYSDNSDSTVFLHSMLSISNDSFGSSGRILKSGFTKPRAREWTVPTCELLRTMSNSKVRRLE